MGRLAPPDPPATSYLTGVRDSEAIHARPGLPWKLLGIIAQIDPGEEPVGGEKVAKRIPVAAGTPPPV